MMAGCAVRRSDTLSVAFDEEDIADRANADFPGELPEDDEVFSSTQTLSGQSGCQSFKLCDVKGSFHIDYELTGDVLGVGMCGAVQTAVDKRWGQKVAVKAFKYGKLTQRERIDLQREIVNQSALDHPSVARLQAVYRSSKSVRLVLEHLDGGDLCKHVEQSGPLGEAATVRVIRQVLQAVDYMHRNGLVHRDIKLENIVYESSDQDRVKLIDFGLCTSWEERMEPLRRFCGTVSYMAPEVQKGSYTSKVDLWCVGTAAYTLLTGELLCRRSDWAPIFGKRFGDLSAEAKNFVTALLTVDPTSRMTASEALRHRWMQDCKVKDIGCRSHAHRTFGSATTAATATSFGRTTAPQSDHDTEFEFSGGKYELEGPGQLAPLAEGKTSLWKSLPSMPGASGSKMFSSKKMSTLWATVRKSKAGSRVAPEMEEQHPGAASASSDAWYGLIPPNS